MTITIRINVKKGSRFEAIINQLVVEKKERRTAMKAGTSHLLDKEKYRFVKPI
jgi:hypothetical protein